jgi:serine/threonine-protein kinase
LLRARQQLGKYRIVNRLADGPIATVYQARDTIQGLDVALKVLHPGAMNEDFLVDFKREARLAPRLEHPNILPIRDASLIDDHFVIVMPLGKETLTERMGRRMATRTALDLIDQMLAAVAHAHLAGIIHCDIKPDNFILFDGGRIRLTDFGFSKIANRTIKASGSGTVGYIAPEQAVGRPMFQSDVFSLGLVVFELLTGRLPEWPYDWPPPGIDRLKSKLSPAQIAWLKRAIAARPEQRYRDADVMYREFKRLGTGHGKRRKRRTKAEQTADPVLWQKVLFNEFQRKYRQVLDTRLECSHCAGPISEFMLACPWCGSRTEPRQQTLSFPAHCPRCHRGSKLDWKYCAWCYGAGFEVETKRRYGDRRYSARCSNAKCRQSLMPFMRYCPWCRHKVTRPWKLPGSEGSCRSCGWGVDADFWHHCPWCTRELAR